MGIFRKLYRGLFNFNMKNYDSETNIMEDLENNLEQKNSIKEMVKLAISSIESVINIRGELANIPQKGLKSLYCNLTDTKTLYDQVKILSEGTGTGWASIWHADLRKIFKKELRKMDPTDVTPAQPTLISHIEKQEEKNEEQIETFKKNKDQIEGIKEDSESKKNLIVNDIVNIKKSDEKNGDKVELPKSKEEKIEEIKKDLNNRNFKPEEIKEIIKAAEYLFENGYGDKDLLFLGKGGYNTVFRIANTDRVVKYCRPRNTQNDGLSADEMSLREFEEMLKKIEDPELKKWSEKYLSKSTRINKKDIYEDKLASGDLFDITLSKKYQALSNESTKKKSMDSLLKKAKNVAKSILVLHNSGYVHQDIKPENILHLPNPKYLEATQKATNGETGNDKYGTYSVISEKSADGKTRYFKEYKFVPGDKQKKRKISKNTINLADYGLMRKIENETGKTQRCGTPKYEGLDDKTKEATSGDDVKKRDVYALGMTFAALLRASDFNIAKDKCGKQWGEYVKLTLNGTDEQNFRKFEKWYEDYKPTGERTLSNLYGDNEKMRVFHFVKLINDMTGSRDTRPLMGDVIAKIRKIERLKKD